MDWKYILSISPDNLDEDEKENLYTKIAWFDCQSEKLDYTKYDALFKISQELMKHKSEQVEALLAELDELAVRQGEEEAKKQESLEDVPSLKSKRSQMSFDTNDELERKYKELKQKLKQQLKVNENLRSEFEKCKRNLAAVEEENTHLKSEIQSILSQGDESRSDMSEATTDQYKELVQTVQLKNKQISQLLDDIQIIEKENIVLQEMISKLKDELLDASKQLSTMTKDYSALKVEFNDKLDTNNHLRMEIEAFQTQIQDFIEEKQQRDQEIDEFTLAIDKRADEWKTLLQEKDKELKRLKYEVRQTSVYSSKMSIPDHGSEDKAYVGVLNKAISERDDQLTELRIRLQEATKEMDKSTKLINQITSEKNACIRRIDESSSIIKNLKNQLKAAHERCQELQDNIKYADQLVENKQKDINEILDKLKQDGQIELSKGLEEVQNLKSKVRAQDKQITDYVKIMNKLQTSIDCIANENSALRNKLGVPEDEEVSIAGVLLKQHKQSRSVDKLEKQLTELEEDKLNLKSEIQQLNRKVSTLSLKLLHSNEMISNVEDATNSNAHNVKLDLDNHSVEGKQEYVELLEENEGLRKGLHEILESIQARNDTRHISGWYHPAMRLQAELHTMKGVNKELREQLKATRLELSTKHQIIDSDRNAVVVQELPSNMSSSAKEMVSNLNNHLLNALGGYHEQAEMSEKLTEKLDEYKERFEISEQQVKLLYDQFMSEKKVWEGKETSYGHTIRELEENVAVLEAKLQEFSNMQEDEYEKVKRFAEISANMVKLNRKCVFLENEETRLSSENKELKANLANAELVSTNVISKLTKEKNDLNAKLDILDTSIDGRVDRQILNNLQTNFDNLTIKYRASLENVEIIKRKGDQNTIFLNESIKHLEKHNVELQAQLLKTSISAHIQESISVSNDLQTLSAKLAQVEINEIEERQRANHMTSLYGLVKEQLQKSDERIQEHEKHREELVRNNLALQENLVTLENNLITYVDLQTLTELEQKKVTIERDLRRLQTENENLKSELKALHKSAQAHTNERAIETMELLNLKHQLLDLQSNSDEKALIARLSSDVVLARLSETECHKKLQELDNELLECQSNYDMCQSILQQEKLERENLRAKYDRKISNLETIIYLQRQQYLGSLPLVSKEAFISQLREIMNDKQKTYEQLQCISRQKHECELLNDELKKKIELVDELKIKHVQSSGDAMNQIQNWYQERNSILIKELRYRKQIELNNLQVEQLTERLKNQDGVIISLEEALVRSLYSENFLSNEVKREDKCTATSPFHEVPILTHSEPKVLKQQEVQTSSELLAAFSGDKEFNALIVELEKKLNASDNVISEKCATIDQLKSKITELEMNISLFRTQIGDKQSQITFYEKHILELQNKLKKTESEGTKVNTVEQSHVAEEVVSLKNSLKQLQDDNSQKDEVVLKYQTLLKRDRDEHSLAAARSQQELKRLQDIISGQEKAYKELQETSIQHPGKAAIEQYINQVHALEHHTAALHTDVSTLTSQLQACRQEAVRWQELANERLESIDQLRTNLEEQHRNEIMVYKKDSEKWRSEIFTLKELISKHRHELHLFEPDSNTVKEKDEKIRELNSAVKRLKSERKEFERAELASPKVSELESVNEQLMKEYELMKRKYEQVISRERQAKEELRNLKEQILKKPLSARSDRSDKEERLQKRIKTLETELEDTRDKLEKQLVINGAHKITVTEDFEKWKKQKYWQQAAEKLKSKLQEKCEDYNKLNQTCAGYKILIERLEREKHTLESRVKGLRHTSHDVISKRVEMLHLENDRLVLENENLSSRLQMQHLHSGGLGAAMLEEKLQAQEKKIAILEVTNKGNVEIRAEIERLHTINENLQKLNLRLESENLELKLDLEKYANDTPHLREQIQHLESYIEVLKAENEGKHVVSDSGDHAQKSDKKISELERTVFVLKRVVEKLQAENKRLGSSGKICNTSDRMGYEKLRLDYNRLKEQYAERIQEISKLEELLKSTNKKITLLEQRELSKEVNTLADEMSRVKAELAHKSQLLDKIKVLLQRAASKEKSLLEETNLNNVNATIRQWLRQKLIQYKVLSLKLSLHNESLRENNLIEDD
ncbi:centrosomal protein of 290 kDa isoform X2 [Photinus pyralis]|uniref:centrosomal protein of 290 kDa isoform X2 n=1 Tax=Photinus pyralis TaxID=7054 RepID=UPI0012670B27|nr:centrosomal protein of 290 kDa isoform X2 [Photinus pyralis]